MKSITNARVRNVPRVVAWPDRPLETSASQVTYTKVATGLDVPMGIAAIGNKLYVTEKTGLTELSADTDGDGLMERKTLVTLPNGGNFHEFNFGLLYDEDFFYVNRSVAINQGGATTSPPGCAAFRVVTS